MEANACDVNHLDADVLLPPRKRLLACLKKQNGDGNLYTPSTSCSTNEFDHRLNRLLQSHLDHNDLSEEEMVKAARSAAEAAAKVALAARAAAEEKAVIAAKAMAAAKNALDLVANVSEEVDSKGKYWKKSKMKKQVQVQMLYNNHKKQRVENVRKDEELARKLHLAINSSPRTLKSDLPSEGHRHKRMKSLSPSENSAKSNGTTLGEEIAHFSTNSSGIASGKEASTVIVDENTSRVNEVDTSKMENGEAERIRFKDKLGDDDISILARKRGKMKQKKLPLSICNFRAQENAKEDLISRSSEMSDENTGKASPANKPLISAGPSSSAVMPVERSSLWKCQAFKASTCVKQSKVLQS